MASTVGSSVNSASRTVELIRQQEAQRRAQLEQQRQAQAAQTAQAQVTGLRPSPTGARPSQPSIALFRGDTFTPSAGRAPVQLNPLAPQLNPRALQLNPLAPQLNPGIVPARHHSIDGGGGAAPVDEAKVDDAEKRIREAGDAGGTALADELRDEDLSAADKHALIERIIKGDNAAELLSTFDHLQEERNYDYDDATTVATAIADAYEAGVITDEELRGLAEDLGEEGSAELAAQLALDPANTRPGGVVEAFGRQADAAGHEQAAAIAFSSSQELIDANLPTAAEQRAAFEDVREYLESQDRDDLSNEQQAFYSIAAGNAVRLSANGNGFTDSELQDFVQDLGPSLAGEVIARARNTPGDSAPGGSLEALGLAAREISGGDLSEEDREEWELNSAVALTASPELIDAHLQGTAGLEAFKTLTEAAHSQYETAEEARDSGYSLLRFPEITEGAAALFEQNADAILTASVRTGDGVLDQDHLNHFLQSTAFSPFTSPEVKQQVQGALTEWTQNHIQVGETHDEGALAYDIGQVLGITQNAADASIDRVGDDEEARVEAENEAKEFIAKLGGGFIGSAVGLYNPLLGGVAGPLAEELINQALPQGDVEAARAAAEEEFRRELEAQGANPDLGRALLAARETYLRSLQDAINNRLQGDGLTQEQRNRLSTATDVLSNIRQSLETGYEEARGR